jgi:hypothetical protein
MVESASLRVTPRGAPAVVSESAEVKPFSDVEPS